MKSKFLDPSLWCVSRRKFLKIASMAGAGAVSGFPRGLRAHAAAWQQTAPQQTGCLAGASTRYAPFLEPYLKQIAPGNDEFLAEKYAYDLKHLLDGWVAALSTSRPGSRLPENWLPDTLEGATLGHGDVKPVRGDLPLQTYRVTFRHTSQMSKAEFLSGLAGYLSTFAGIEFCDAQIDSIEIVSQEPLRVRTAVRYDLTGRLDIRRREQRTGRWAIDWQHDDQTAWRITRWGAETETRSRLTGPGFEDVTAVALGHNDSYARQIMYGVDHWRSTIDSASGIDVYGNNGLCVGDFDDDGWDDLYVCQPAGLPNRLYRNRRDGTFEDVTEKAGVGVLDGTACALFADLTNNGRQDLIVVRNNGPLLFVNRGDGTFELKPDAYTFARPLDGSFTGASLADYDRDGLLDVYFCTYSRSEGAGGEGVPMPYHDAQNGPPNFLMRNRGKHSFEDVTVASGMDVSNTRYSFAGVWNDFDRDGWPDLYVVNDFGRKVLYRNQRDGTFKDVSAQAGVEVPGEGMSMTWLDYDNDGREDMYVVNMWEPAGSRVTSQPQFMPLAPEAVRQVVRLDALGNILLHCEGDTATFRDKTDDSGTRYGGWNWGSDAWDLDHDGNQDMYVANGFISGASRDDVSSFFWRHIAARSADQSGHSHAYVDAWSAINEFIRSDYSWSGYQRNNLYVNNSDGTFSEAASVLGLGCIEDGRAFALGDLDGDGRLEVIVKNRTAPQVRVFHNRMEGLAPSIVFKLRGQKSNRDAIGAVVELNTGGARQMRTVRAGTGFLTQNTKALHFGLGKHAAPLSAVVRWPSGLQQVLENLPPNHTIEVVEGVQGFKATQFNSSAWTQAEISRTANPHSSAAPQSERPEFAGTAPKGVWLLEPVSMPDVTLTDAKGTPRSLKEPNASTQLVAFVSPGCSESTDFLAALQRGHDNCKKAGLTVVAIAMDNGAAPATLSTQLSFPVLSAAEKSSRVLEVFRRYLFDRRLPMPLPSAMLLDENLNVLRVYAGPVDVADAVADASRIPRSAAERIKAGLPFSGRLYAGTLRRDYFTLGLAYMQYEAYDAAQAALEKSLERGGGNALAYYDLGLIALYRNQPDVARRRLQKAVELDPNNADAWNNLGVAAGQSGDQDEAQRNFQKALDRQPAHPNALDNMIRIFQNQNRPADARTLLRKAIEADPSQPAPHRQLGSMMLESGDFAAARTELQKADSLEPHNAETLNALGVVYMQTHEDDRAQQNFSECMRLAPDFDGPVLNLAFIYASAGQPHKARELLSEFSKRHPDNRDVRQALSELEGRH